MYLCDHRCPEDEQLSIEDRKQEWL